MNRNARLMSLRTPIASAVSVAFAAALTLNACGSSTSSSSSAPATTTEEVVQEETAAAEPITDDETTQWLNGTSGYTGREATVTGRVFNIEHNGDVHVYQINTDPKNYDGNTIVYFEGSDPGIAKDDYIRATGTIQEDMEYQNAFGATMSAPLIQASTVERISYQDAVSPTLATVELNAANQQNGYTVTLQKIEFAEDETRFYIGLTNNGAGRLSVYDYSAVVIQNGRQYNTQSNYQADYPDINDELAIGASIEGVVCFPPLEQTSMQLQMQGYSDNYEVDGGSMDFNFDITL